MMTTAPRRQRPTRAMAASGNPVEVGAAVAATVAALRDGQRWFAPPAERSSASRLGVRRGGDPVIESLVLVAGDRLGPVNVGYARTEYWAPVARYC